jgi:PadR family transcriptional regulator, regulatory protein AphA
MSMARNAAAKYVILGWLGLEPLSGYDLRERIRNSTGYFWQESFGSIYPNLARLQADGLIEPVAGATGHPSRRVYRSTAGGRKLLREWLAEPYAHTLTRNEFALKLFFGSHLAPADLRRHLERYRDEHRESHRDLTAIEDRLAAAPPGPAVRQRLLTVRLGLKLCEATLAWCDDALVALGPDGEGQ